MNHFLILTCLLIQLGDVVSASGEQSLNGVHRVRIIATRQSGRQSFALVKFVDSNLLTNGQTFSKHFEPLTEADSAPYTDINNLDVRFYADESVSESSVAVDRVPYTVQDLLSTEEMCGTMYKDLCTTLRLYRALHHKHAKVNDSKVNESATLSSTTVTTAISTATGLRLRLVTVPEGLASGKHLENLTFRLRDTSGTLVLQRAVQEHAPHLVQHHAYTRCELRMEQVGKVLLLAQQRHEEQEKQQKKGVERPPNATNTDLLIADLRAIESEMERTLSEIDERCSALETVHANAHNYGNNNLEELVIAARSNNDDDGDENEGLLDDEARSAICVVYARHEAFSHAVAVQLRSLNEPTIDSARCQQYLQAPTPAERLRLLAADVAQLNAHLKKLCLAKAALTAEQIKQLEELGIGETTDLEPDQNLPREQQQQEEVKAKAAARKEVKQFVSGINKRLFYLIIIVSALNYI